jgi:hypothetical protein
MEAFIMEDGHIRVPVLATRVMIFIDSGCPSIYKNFLCLETSVFLYFGMQTLDKTGYWFES